ncbi:spermidine synthase [Streptomyces sp. DvalAA-14]|uniref:polyamine aminopropyltransferase n=1 Tax=unclassified Streptomyces TaxID=2593676 RepID=UPI00081B6FEC|nr:MULTISPECIES: polyamine aminopropyltransferase [unclassified Streptomyces]MYS20851.1 polyamine aminopropyltransferase [Streptomyces sp. SID4948]SCD78482.1 spermidine synthase [Streptomyces sp. DvalAA-14]
MIDQQGRTSAARLAVTLPVPAGAARALVLAAVFVCAACGLIYELELVALASYLVGDSVTQASVVLSVMVFAMGCGSLLAKRLRGCAALGFAAVEAALALVGGLSVMVLYAVFAWYGEARPAIVGCSFAIGVLIGAEVPLLMTLVQRVRRQDAGGAVADLFAVDYVGALVGGLAFPFLLLPDFGQLTGALVTGVVNAVAGGATVLWLFRGDLSPRARGWLVVANLTVLAVLAAAAMAAGPFERAARQAVYGGAVRVARQTAVQEIVLTGTPDTSASLRLYLDGRLRVCGADSAGYDRALAVPAMAAGPHGRVLVLGGADGLALREVLGFPGVRAVTVVDTDAVLMRLGRADPGLVALNGDAFDDGRVRVATADVFDWLRTAATTAPGSYDVILADLPAAAVSSSAKLYSQEFYGLAARALAPNGRLAVHAAQSVWTVAASLRAAGLPATAYRLPAAACPAPPGLRPAPTTWAFLLAGSSRPPLPASFHRAAAAAARSRPATSPPPSTLLHPRL